MFRYILSSFKKTNGPLITLFSMPLGYFAWILRPNDSLPLWIALPVFVITGFVVFVLFGALQEAIEFNVKPPGVLRAMKPVSSNNGNRSLTILINNSNQLGINTMITLYEKKDDFEIQLGVGYIETINTRGLIQAVVYEDPVLSSNETWDKLAGNDEKVLRQLMAKPSVPRSSYFYRDLP